KKSCQVSEGDRTGTSKRDAIRNCRTNDFARSGNKLYSGATLGMMSHSLGSGATPLRRSHTSAEEPICTLYVSCFFLEATNLIGEQGDTELLPAAQICLSWTSSCTIACDQVPGAHLQ
ncbi:hypothetical protein STEG23_009610, partial [Scotinomys teguina]